MIGFRTQNNTYYVDTQKKLIWGGKLGDEKLAYTKGTFIIGSKGKAKLEDGRYLVTTTIIDYIDKSI